MQACANACSAAAAEFARVSHNPYAGANAFTFWPDYSTTQQLSGQKVTPGMCVIGHVREPFYQTLTPHDNGAISGFALSSMSRENQRFLFG
jgi:hypothetical protein